MRKFSQVSLRFGQHKGRSCQEGLVIVAVLTMACPAFPRCSFILLFPLLFGLKSLSELVFLSLLIFVLPIDFATALLISFSSLLERTRNPSPEGGLSSPEPSDVYLAATSRRILGLPRMHMSPPGQFPLSQNHLCTAKTSPASLFCLPSVSSTASS